MRDASDMPKLQKNPAAGLVHRVSYEPPALDLFAAVDAGRPRITLPLHRGLGCFADDERGGRPLRIVACVERSRHVAGLSRTRARERRHDDAVGKCERAEPVRLKQQLGRCLLNSHCFGRCR
jgi:hypothetical protein